MSETPRVAVMTITRNKMDLVQESFASLNKMAGEPFHHFVLDNGSEDVGWLEVSSRVYDFQMMDHNMGISIGKNLLVDCIKAQPIDYDYILNWDPDLIAKSKRFLKRLVDFADECIDHKDPSVIGPKVTKLETQPTAIASGIHNDMPFDVMELLGGCQLFPMGFWEGWRHNHFLPMAAGQDNEIAGRCRELGWGLVRLPKLRVEHAHGARRQEELYPDEFGYLKVLRMHLSYGLVD